MITNQSSNAIHCQLPISEVIPEFKIIAYSKKLKKKQPIWLFKEMICFLQLLSYNKTCQWAPKFKKKRLHSSFIMQNYVVNLEELCFLIANGNGTPQYSLCAQRQIYGINSFHRCLHVNDFRVYVDLNLETLSNCTVCDLTNIRIRVQFFLALTLMCPLKFMIRALIWRTFSSW